MKKYTIGLDYGTLSARGVLLDLQNGDEVAISEYIYPDSVITGSLNGVKLDDSAAFQNPADYVDAIKYIVSETDSPYLTPHPYRGKPNDPSYVPLVAKEIAEIKGVEIEEVAKMTTQNALNTFQIERN